MNVEIIPISDGMKQSFNANYILYHYSKKRKAGVADEDSG